MKGAGEIKLQEIKNNILFVNLNIDNHVIGFIKLD